ncbi:MAG: TIGR04282 family arsenosugar biosynthesis glycosyltransferase [Halofilum sp. (in: g-proteobacteria)]
MEARLLVFARAPVAGATKTRLIPALGPDGAAQLHAALIAHTLAVAAVARPYELQLWHAGDDANGTLGNMAGAAGASLHRQPEGDLGARMEHALGQATADSRAAIVIGTDCPWLSGATLQEAAAMLDSAAAVIGPADDGGYVLLGLRGVAPSLFADIEWGTDKVLATTRERLAALGWGWRELTARPDVDRPEDLDALAELGGQWTRLAQPARRLSGKPEP